MAKFNFHMGVTLRCYGNVEVEAESIEAATAMMTADYLTDRIEIHETTTDSGQDLAVIDVTDAEGNEIYGEEMGELPPNPYDPQPDADLLAALQMAIPALEWCEKQWANSPQHGDGLNVLDFARAVIAKASPSTRRDGPVLREGE